jgi:hypothetical protein
VNAGAFDAYDLVFAPAADGGSGTAESFTGVTSLTVSLNPGKYDLAFTAKKGNVTAAEGTVQNITVSGGQTVNVTVPLVFKPEAGTGTLSFSITRPSGFDLSGAGFTLTPLHEGGTSYGTDWLNALYIKDGENEIPLTRSGAETVASGYYQTIVTLSTSERKAVKNDIVHIGAGQITTLEWSFVEADFSTIVEDIWLLGVNDQWQIYESGNKLTQEDNGTFVWAGGMSQRYFRFSLESTAGWDDDKDKPNRFQPESDHAPVTFGTPASMIYVPQRTGSVAAWDLGGAGYYRFVVDPYAKTVMVTRPVTVTGVIVKDANGDTTTALSLPQGTIDYEFTAEVQGTNAEGTGVNWAISSGTVAGGTAIEADGKLTIAGTETSGNTFTVTATSTADPASSGSVTVTVTNNAPPAAPTAAPSLTPGNTRLTVSWTAVIGADAYEVWYGTDSDSGAAAKWDDSDETDLAATITGLTNWTRYAVWIKAKNGGGTSGFSPGSLETPVPEKYLGAEKASGDTVSPAGNDLAALYVTSDADKLYIALDFEDLSDFWVNDRLTLIIDKAGDSSGYQDGTSVDGWQLAAGTMTFTNGEADIYFFHNPTQTNTGASVLHVDGSVLEADWAGNPSKVTASSYHWDNPDYPSFLEYGFALSDLNLVKDDVIRIFAVVSNRWSDSTTHATDIVPEITPTDPPDNQNVTFDFNSALSYTVK